MARTASDTGTDLLRVAAQHAPNAAMMTGLADPPTGPLPFIATADGARLRDPAWMRDQVRASAQRWRTDSPRVAATLWWYTASTVLLAPPLLTDFLAGRAVHPGPEGLELRFAEAGRLVAARTTTPCDGPLTGPLRELIATCADGLAAAAGMRPRPLWSIAADSLAGLLVRAGRETGGLEESTGHARSLAAEIGAPLPEPRWVDVRVPDGSDGLFPPPPPDAPEVERFVRRGSCCLIYEAPGEAKCAACPRRTPDDRALQLELAASRMAALG
ncbi:(2Fe-2S)-binding protein [Streptomyces sp. ODS28]|uniref:(2Fe-2S)-binding protein n=1 Tax=Streptomyces sp. ODS28 TaxID=3136688 RepID=UPI0031EE989F